jgi:hypothetical protein
LSRGPKHGRMGVHLERFVSGGDRRAMRTRNEYSVDFGGSHSSAKNAEEWGTLIEVVSAGSILCGCNGPLELGLRPDHRAELMLRDHWG